MNPRHSIATEAEAFLDRTERMYEMVDRSVELAHMEARATRLLKDAETLKAQLMENRAKREAIDRAEVVCSAIEDLREAIRAAGLS